jgi:ribosomal protein S18 acetylase RimI-like enzyme
MTAPAEIRPFQPGDRSQVLALAPRLTEGVAPWRDPAAVRHAAQNWVQTSIDTAAEPGHAFYVAIAGDRVVGVVGIREQPHFTGQTDAYVGELAVAPGMERRGIATALMNAAEAWAARRGLAFLTLHTGAANQPARSLYRRLGYHEEELLLTKAILARHNHPNRQRHNRQLCADPPRGTRDPHAAQSRREDVDSALALLPTLRGDVGVGSRLGPTW